MDGNNQVEINLFKDLEKTGYPAELRAGNAFARSGWDVHYNVYYMDWDERKGGEIDLVAFNAVHSKEHNVWVKIYLCSEVKKSVDPWVIFTTKSTGLLAGLELPGWRRLHLAFSEIDHHILPANKLDEKSTIRKFQRFGHSFYVAFAGTQSKPTIFSALTKSVKASEDCLRHLNEIIKGDEERLGQSVTSGRDLILIEPLVILDGELYEAYLDKDNKIVINRVNHTPICFGYLSPEYRRADHFNDYLVEVVTTDGLSDLISNKMKWLHSIKRTIVKNLIRKETPT